MRKAALILVLVGCTAVEESPRLESVAIPGTSLRFAMARIAGRGPIPTFWMGAREVTWEEFDRFYGSPDEESLDGVTRPSSGKDYLALGGLPNDFLLPERPLTNIRYHSAVLYCEWLSRKTGAQYRLPTEPEWSLACGTAPSDAGWTLSTSGGRTHRGGEKGATASGVYDLWGNVWEYALEPAHPPDFEPVLLGGAWNTPSTARQSPPDEWSEADPNRPFSTWWFRAGHSQGIRVVRVGEASGKAERESIAKRLEITRLAGTERTVKVGTSVSLYSRVTGSLRNSSDRSLDEVILKVFYLTKTGKPHPEDVTNTLTRRATFNLAMPVLVTSAHPGPHARPLAPGETRTFTVDIPSSFDAEDSVDLDRYGASVLTLRVSP
ncbi:MAG TPA: SUMF1/EgtB/PvdO family nonheme iron enzyme [Planctomycetota bacterium]|nr:SUMF1/EgtB/PvdO family nonheme iron enzyme [Planctomycetota bacterium]